MPKERIFPHRTATADCITFGDWWIKRSGTPERLPELLTGWDYASEVELGSSATIDVERLLSSTGHTSLNALELILLVECAATQRRFLGRRNLHDARSSEPVTASLRVPPGELADRLRLSAHIVVARDLDGLPPRVACMAGALIASSPKQTMLLEGEAARFPTEPIAFSLHGRPYSPWTLDIAFEDPASSFMGGVRLLVNTEHPVGRKLLDASTVEQVSPIVMADVLRLLVATLSQSEYSDYLETALEEDGSVANVVDQMCQTFIHESLETATQQYRREPLYFDSILHSNLEPLAKVIQ